MVEIELTANSLFFCIATKQWLLIQLAELQTKNEHVVDYLTVLDQPLIIPYFQIKYMVKCYVIAFRFFCIAIWGFNQVRNYKMEWIWKSQFYVIFINRKSHFTSKERDFLTMRKRHLDIFQKILIITPHLDPYFFIKILLCHCQDSLIIIINFSVCSIYKF